VQAFVYAESFFKMLKAEAEVDNLEERHAKEGLKLVVFEYDGEIRRSAMLYRAVTHCNAA
jgi:hypothetical protein